MMSLFRKSKHPVGFEWMPKETAPTDGTRVLVWDELNGEISIAHYVNGDSPAFRGWFHWNDWIGGARFSHWAPLPPKPEGV